MIKSQDNKLFKYSFILVIILSLVISLAAGIIQKPKVEQYKVFKIYTKEDENTLSDYVDKGMLKQYNILNSEFGKRYTGELRVEVSPQEGIYSYYRIKVTANRNIDEKELDKIFSDYIQFIKQKDIINIQHISTIKHNNSVSSNLEMKNILIGLTQWLAFAISFYVLFNILKKKLSWDRLFSFSVISILAYLTAVAFGVAAVVITLNLALAAAINIIDTNKANRKELVVLSLAALLMRGAVTIVMLIYNYYKYRTLYSYTQTDEIFYYSTSDYISQALTNFQIPNLKDITGIDQYGYNLFIGIVKLANNGEIFFTSKIINIAASTIFVMLFFDFVYRITKEKNIAVISGLLMALMPTFAVFSSFALRDIFISISIFIIFSQVIYMEDSPNRFGNIIKIIVFSVFLWYLRRYALLLTLAFGVLYVIIKFCINKKINVFVIVSVLALVLTALVFVASKIYSFNIFNMIKNYIYNAGILRFFTGIILSLVNLDFIINSGATLYTSTKYIILRSLYPETLFLVVTFPIMCLGLVKSAMKNISLAITMVLMFVGFISIYKIQYGGWFLRTQLQIFPYQYMFIAWGINEMISKMNIKKIIKI